MSEDMPRIRYRERVRSESSPGVAQTSLTRPKAADGSTNRTSPTNAPDQNEAAALASAIVPAPVPAATVARAAASYEIGYRKPPKATQFQRGRSGNPKGRPKHAKNTRTIVTELLDRIISVTAQGRSRKISVREAGLQQIGKRAVEKGDLKSFAFLLNVEGGGLGSPSSTRSGRGSPSADSFMTTADLSAQELEILAFAHRERLRDGGFGDEQIDMVLASLRLLPAMPAASGPAPHPAADDRDVADSIEDA